MLQRCQTSQHKGRKITKAEQIIDMGAIPLPFLPPSSSPTHLILRRLLLPPLFHISSTPKPPHLFPILTSTTTSTSPFFSTSSASFIPHSLSASQTLIQPLNDVADIDDEESADEDKVIDSDDDVAENATDNLKTNILTLNTTPPPSLTIKEKKELASYAHSLGKKLKSQQVGKSGVTDTVIIALIETLEKNELLKIKIHGNCPEELDVAVEQVARGTGSVAVSKIGRTVILYRPSATKLEREQKKKEARRIRRKKQSGHSVWVRSSSQGKEELPKLSGRGRRGSSRV